MRIMSDSTSFHPFCHLAFIVRLGLCTICAWHLDTKHRNIEMNPRSTLKCSTHFRILKRTQVLLWRLLHSSGLVHLKNAAPAIAMQMFVKRELKFLKIGLGLVPMLKHLDDFQSPTKLVNSSPITGLPIWIHLVLIQLALSRVNHLVEGLCRMQMHQLTNSVGLRAGSALLNIANGSQMKRSPDMLVTRLCHLVACPY